MITIGLIQNSELSESSEPTTPQISVFHGNITHDTMHKMWLIRALSTQWFNRHKKSL